MGGSEVLLGQRPSLHILRWCLAPLFGYFVGTTALSDSPPAFMLVVELVAFSSQSGLLLPDACGVSPFLSRGISRHALGL